jgi:hypothetical protein
MPTSEPSSEAAMMRDTVFDTVDTVRPPVSQTGSLVLDERRVSGNPRRS